MYMVSGSIPECYNKFLCAGKLSGKQCVNSHVTVRNRGPVYNCELIGKAENQIQVSSSPG